MKKQKFNHDWIFTVGSGSSLDALAGGNNMAKQGTLPHDASIGRERNPEERTEAEMDFSERKAMCTPRHFR